MKRITHSVLTVLASLALVSPLYAAEQWSHQARGTTFNQNTMLEDNNTDSIDQTGGRTVEVRSGLSRTDSAGQLIGLPVVAQDGENIGEVQDLKVDTRTGRIDYVIVEKEDAMGVGESIEVAVPLGALQFTDDNARLTVDKSKLNNVPNPALMSESEFHQGLHTHYGIAPTFQEERTIIHREERSKTLKP